MRRYDIIEITLKNSQTVVWDAEQWDNYICCSTIFDIFKENVLVGMYSMDCVASIVVKDSKSGGVSEHRPLGNGLSTMGVGRKTTGIFSGSITVSRAPSHVATALGTEDGRRTMGVGHETMTTASGSVSHAGTCTPPGGYKCAEGVPADSASYYHAEAAGSFSHS